MLKYYLAIVASVFTLLWPESVYAQVVTRYDTREAFTAAANGPFIRNSFNAIGSDASFRTIPLDFGTFSIAGVGSGQLANRNLIDVPPLNATYAFDDTAYALINVGLNSRVTLTFANPITAFGADFTGLDDVLGLNVAIGGSAPLLTVSTSTRAFRGYISDTPFTTLTFSSALLPNTFGMDNVIFSAAAPEPVTWTMLLFGFAATGWASRGGRRVAGTLVEPKGLQ